MANGLTGIKDLTTAINNGQIAEYTFQKLASSGTSNVWQELLTASGSPTATTFSGTAGVATAMNSSTTGAMPLNGNVSPQLRFLLDGQASIGSTGTVPMAYWLCDFLLYYPNLSVTTTPTTLNNSVTLPRYTNGIGVQSIIAVQTATGFSTAPTLTFTWNGSDSNSYSSALKAPSSSPQQSTCFIAGTDGNGDNNGGLLPWSGTAQGIQSLSSYTITTSSAGGKVCALLFKPLMMFGTYNNSLASEKDMFFQQPAMPQILDGACLGLIRTNTISGLIPNNVRVRYVWN